MEILKIKDWIKIKHQAQFEFIGNHLISRIKDGKRFKLRIPYSTPFTNVELCITYAYTDLIHIDIMRNSSSKTIKIEIDKLNIITNGNDEILYLYLKEP